MLRTSGTAIAAINREAGWRTDACQTESFLSSPGPRPDRRRERVGGGSMTISLDGHGPSVLRVTPEIGPGTVFLQLAGDMDVATAPHLPEIVRSLPADQPQHVRIDLADLDFLDAAGLTALLHVKEIVQARHGHLSLHRPRPVVLRILDVTGLADAFDVDAESVTPRDLQELA